MGRDLDVGFKAIGSYATLPAGFVSALNSAWTEENDVGDEWHVLSPKVANSRRCRIWRRDRSAEISEIVRFVNDFTDRQFPERTFLVRVGDGNESTAFVTGPENLPSLRAELLRRKLEKRGFDVNAADFDRIYRAMGSQ